MDVFENLTVGWLDANIRTVVRKGLLSRFHSVLITSIDSTTDLPASAIGKRIVAFDSNCSFLGAGVVVPGDMMVQINETLNLLHGFDEVWCFDRAIVTPKPDDLWIASPAKLKSGSISSALTAWMKGTDCKLALGDGDGLNFATSRAQIARDLRTITSTSDQ